MSFTERVSFIQNVLLSKVPQYFECGPITSLVPTPQGVKLEAWDMHARHGLRSEECLLMTASLQLECSWVKGN